MAENSRVVDQKRSENGKFGAKQKQDLSQYKKSREIEFSLFGRFFYGDMDEMIYFSAMKCFIFQRFSNKPSNVIHFYFPSD